MEEARAQPVQQRAEAADTEARQAGREERAFADAHDMAEADQAEQGGRGHHACVHHHLEVAEIAAGAEGQRQHNAFAGLDDEVAGHLQQNAEGKNDDARGQNAQAFRIGQQEDAPGQVHPHVDEEAEQKDRRQLQDVCAGKVRPENDFFQQHKQGVEQDGIRAHAEGIHGVDRKRETGDGRRAHVGIRNKRYAQRRQAHPQHQNNTTNRKRKAIHSDSSATPTSRRCPEKYVSRSGLSKRGVGGRWQGSCWGRGNPLCWIQDSLRFS